MLASLYPSALSGGLADFELVKDEPDCPDRHGDHGNVGKIDVGIAATGVHHRHRPLSSKTLGDLAGHQSVLEVLPDKINALAGDLEAAANVLRITLIDEVRARVLVRFEVAGKLRKLGVLAARIRLCMLV
jgi:hypothetical protein